MKQFLVILVGMLLVQSGFASAPLMVCEDIQVMTDLDEATGQPIYQSEKGSVTVLADVNGKYGHAAVVTLNGSVNVEYDTKVQNLTAQDLKEENLQYMLQLAFPDVPTATYVKGRAADIGVEANLDDAAGLVLIELYDAQDKVVAKVLRIGWGFGICKK